MKWGVEDSVSGSSEAMGRRIYLWESSGRWRPYPVRDRPTGRRIERSEIDGRYPDRASY